MGVRKRPPAADPTRADHHEGDPGMRIRLHGPADELPAVLDALRQVLDLTDISRPYPDRPPSPNHRIYIEATPRSENGDQR